MQDTGKFEESLVPNSVFIESDDAKALLLPGRTVAVYGIGATGSSMRLAAYAACINKQVLYLCGDNYFDVYEIARSVDAQLISRDEALRRILVARAFTSYQLERMIHRLKHEESNDSVVIVSGICTAFFDEDVADADAARLFYRSINKLKALSHSGMAVLLIQNPIPERSKRIYFLNDLLRNPNFVIRLMEKKSHQIKGNRQPIVEQLSLPY